MKCRAKTSNKYNCSIWVFGEYITGTSLRSEGYYIDKGGSIDANIFEIDKSTLCRKTKYKDCTGANIYEKDFIRHDYMRNTDKEIDHSYCIAEINTRNELEIIDFCTGEILSFIYTPGIQESNFKVIGNSIDNETFINDIKRVEDQVYAEFNIDKIGKMPCIPLINVQLSPYPYWRCNCTKCGHSTWLIEFKTICSECGSVANCTLTTEIEKESVSV